MKDTPPAVPACSEPRDFFEGGFGAATVGALAGALEEGIGQEDAASFVARVGDDMGRRIGEAYRDAQGNLPTDTAALAAVLVDLKARVGGAFEVAALTDTQMTLTGCRCPFGAAVLGRPSLCQMTTAVFGRIVADATGFAQVDVTRSIARGDPTCTVTVSLTADGGDDGSAFYR